MLQISCLCSYWVARRLKDLAESKKSKSTNILSFIYYAPKFSHTLYFSMVHNSKTRILYFWSLFNLLFSQQSQLRLPSLICVLVRKPWPVIASFCPKSLSFQLRQNEKQQDNSISKPFNSGDKWVLVLDIPLPCSWHQNSNSPIVQFSNLKCWKMPLKKTGLKYFSVMNKNYKNL